VARQDPAAAGAVDLLREAWGEKDTNEASVLILRAAQQTWNALVDSGVAASEWTSDPRTRDLVVVYHSAVSAFVVRNSETLTRERRMRFDHGRERFQVNIEFVGKPGQGRGYFDQLLLAEAVRVRGFSKRSVQDGLGVALVGERDRTEARAEEMKSMPPRHGVYKPLNALLTFSKTGAVLKISDALEIAEGVVNGTRVPLAADFTAPLGLSLSGTNDLLAGITGLFNSRSRIRHAGIYLAEPLDKDRIPVLMIHGLSSSPIIWRDTVANALRHPKIRENYQFWYVYYPSGLPITASSSFIRDKIQEIRQKADPGGKARVSKHLVLIGHSMGAVISRGLSKDVGNNIWTTISDVPFEEISVDEEARARMKKVLFWNAVPGVERGIYIAGPHKGAKLADSSIAQLGIRFMRLPLDLLRSQASILAAIRYGLKPEYQRGRFANSVNSLSPSYPLHEALNKSPDAKGYRYHSIIGDRGRKNTPRSTDGIVAYWSSHLPGAESEIIVPTNHATSFQHPDSQKEIQRILLLNLE
jgi:pimeloyl-ACP methyl ester carboxylesterase